MWSRSSCIHRLTSLAAHTSDTLLCTVPTLYLPNLSFITSFCMTVDLPLLLLADTVVRFSALELPDQFYEDFARWVVRTVAKGVDRWLENVWLYWLISHGGMMSVRGECVCKHVGGLRGHPRSRELPPFCRASPYGHGGLSLACSSCTSRVNR